MGHQQFNVIKSVASSPQTLAIFYLNKQQQITATEDQINFTKWIAVAMLKPLVETEKQNDADP